MGSAVVDDIIIYVVTENAVRVQISFLPGRPPPIAGRCPLIAACLSSSPDGHASLTAGWGPPASRPSVAHHGTIIPIVRDRSHIVDATLPTANVPSY